MNKMHKQYMKAKKQGISNNDLLRMREIARKQAEVATKEAAEKEFLYMLAIPLNVLFNDYWQKSAKKKAPKFIEEVIKLYGAVQQGVVTNEDLADLLDDLAGIRIEADWLKNKEVRNERICRRVDC